MTEPGIDYVAAPKCVDCVVCSIALLSDCRNDIDGLSVTQAAGAYELSWVEPQLQERSVTTVAGLQLWQLKIYVYLKSSVCKIKQLEHVTQ